MKPRFVLALLLGLVAAVSCGIAFATPVSGVSNPSWSPVIGRFADGIDATAKTDVDSGTATDFWQARLSIKGATDVHIIENVLAPVGDATFPNGGTFGWHSHPGPSLVIVKSGMLSVYHGPDCMRQDFGPGSPLGTTFIDQGHDLHMVRNNGTVAADAYVVSFVPAGFARRIDEPNPNPGVCPN